MALEQKLNLRMSQRLIMTPSLQQAIKLLQLSKLELLEEITHELVENPSFEATLTKAQTLTDHRTWQIDATPMDEGTREIADAIVGNLNDDGYLGATLDEIQAMGPYAPADVEAALKTVQSLDPAGVA